MAKDETDYRFDLIDGIVKFEGNEIDLQQALAIVKAETKKELLKEARRKSFCTDERCYSRTVVEICDLEKFCEG